MRCALACQRPGPERCFNEEHNFIEESKRARKQEKRSFLPPGAGPCFIDRGSRTLGELPREELPRLSRLSRLRTLEEVPKPSLRCRSEQSKGQESHSVTFEQHQARPRRQARASFLGFGLAKLLKNLALAHNFACGRPGAKA